MDGDIIDKHDDRDVEQMHDDRDGDTVIKWRTRRLIRHQEDTDELSTLDDLKVQSILYKRDLYESKIRVALSESKITLRQKRSNGLVFKTPKCYIKDITPDCYSEDMKKSVDDQKDVVLNEEMMPDLLTASYPSSVQNYELTVRNDEADVVNMCALRCANASLKAKYLR
jgi:hypothetical protein